MPDNEFKDQPLKPYDVAEVVCHVFYEDGDGCRKTFRVESLTIDHAIEKLGSIERHLEKLKTQHE